MPNKPLSSDAFKKINDPQEKQTLFIDLTNSRAEIQIKFHSPIEKVYKVKAHLFEENCLSCNFSELTDAIPADGELIMSFFLGAEKYFASPKFKISRGQLRIFVDGPVFLLQRREDFRLKIPQAQKVLFEIKLKNESNQVVSCAIKDLSAGGCRLLIDPKKWQPKVGDPIAGTILISGREPIIMEASIKHIKPDSTEKNKLSCGVQFNQISEIQKNRIAAIVMDLFRVFFAKLK